MLRTLSLILTLAATPAAAECYADYKARSDDPYRLAYGVAQVSACDKSGAEQELGPRLAAAGWTLLSVVSVFGPEGLAERQDRAADHFLAY
jgi:hypothetical protein